MTEFIELALTALIAVVGLGLWLRADYKLKQKRNDVEFLEQYIADHQKTELELLESLARVNLEKEELRRNLLTLQGKNTPIFADIKNDPLTLGLPGFHKGGIVPKFKSTNKPPNKLDKVIEIMNEGEEK